MTDHPRHESRLMTDPLTPEWLAALRRMVADEVWELPSREGVAALLDEIDRLTARHRLEHERAETLEAENAKLATERGRLKGELADAESAIDDWAYAVTWREEDADALRKTLAALLPQFREHGHPGEPCRRSGWVPERTLTAAAEVMAVSQRAADARRRSEAVFGAVVPQGAPQPGASVPVAASAQSEPPEDAKAAQRPAEDFRTYRCPTPCDSDCEARCHEGHQVGYKQTHDIAECQARSAAAEAYRRLAPKPLDLSGELEESWRSQAAILHYPDTVPTRTVPITPEDEGISSADAQAQIESDQYMNATVDCPSCDGSGLELDAEGESHGECLRCAGMGRVPDERTPEQWEAHYGVQVHDPDGWRTPGDPRNWNEPITLAEFARRLGGSTLRNVSDPAWSQIRRDARAAEREPR